MFEGIAQQIINKMKEEGKVVTLTREVSAAIDYQLADALIGIKNNFNRKYAASCKYISEIEATTVEA